MIGGGVIAAGDLLLDPAREVMERRALRPARDVVRVEAAASAPTRGWSAPRCSRASTRPTCRRPRAHRARSAFSTESGVMECVIWPGRLVVCPTPIGNLEDVTLRVLAALREADVVACEDTRRTRVLLERYGVQATLVSYHEHNERERAAELVERMQRRRASWRSCPTPACRWSATRATCSCRAASPPGCPSRCCPGRRPRWPRSWRARCPPTRGASPASCRASAARCVEVLASPETRGGVRVAAARRRRRWPCSRSSTPSGPSRSAAS